MVDDRPRPDVVKLEQMYQSGMSMTAIGREVGFTGPTIKKWLVAAGVKVESRSTPPPPPPRSEVRPSDEELKRLYLDEQMSSTEIAEKIGCSSGSVVNWLTQVGVKMRGGPGLDKREGIFCKVVKQFEVPYDRDREGNVLTVTKDELECGHTLAAHQPHGSLRNADLSPPYPKVRRCRRCEKEQPAKEEA